MINTAAKTEIAVLIGVVTRNQTKEQSKEYLSELEFLVQTAGAKVVHTFVQNLDRPDSKTFIGSGKMEDVRAYVVENDVDLVVFDDDLTPSQLRNIERILDCKILDRSNLILDIFAGRARTAHAKTQVELAQYQYLLPRLTRMWTHLQKQKGGIGMKGPGETEIETDRRIIRDKIARLKEKLKAIDKQMSSQRKNRGKMVRVAIVGYTNAGKSTVMNLMSKSNVFAEDKLFATLDTTVRKVVLKNLPFLLADTVGFIRKLPHQLIESFKSTLDEVREADILIHLVDVTHPHFEDHINVVKQTLSDIGASDVPVIMVFNKIDAFTYNPKDEFDLTPIERENYSLDDLRKTWMANTDAAKTLFISASKKQNIDEFREVLYEEIKKIHAIRYPYNSYLY